MRDSNHTPEEEDKDELASEEPTVHPPLESGASTPPHPVTLILGFWESGNEKWAI